MVEHKPPLPPRKASHSSPSEPQSAMSVGESTQYLSPTAPLSPSISPAEKTNSPYSGGLHDPRASSTQSLRPVESAASTGRRTLLIIYIHGFLGDETSFGSFPAHVHSLITSSLAETHVVYTKVYPRYKSRKNVSFARDDFSNWLVSHLYQVMSSSANVPSQACTPRIGYHRCHIGWAQSGWHTRS